MDSVFSHGKPASHPSGVMLNTGLGYNVFVDILHITPDIARLFLEETHKRQRKINTRALSRLIRAASDSGFAFTGDTVKFTADGELCDGQHRLRAIIDTGKTLPTLVVYGIRTDSFAALGETTKWTGEAFLRSQHPDLKGSIASLSGAISMLRRWDGVKVDGSLNSNPATLALFEIENYYLAHARSLRRGMAKVTELRKRVGVPPAPLIAVYTRLSAVNQDAADEFFDILTHGVTDNATMVRLRDKMKEIGVDLSNMGSSAFKRWGLVAVMVKGWNAWRTGSEVKMFRWSSTERFPSIEGYSKKP